MSVQELPTRVPPVAIRLEVVVLDTDDPMRLATFYADLLGWRIVRVEEEWVTVRGEAGVDIACQLLINYRPPTWPSPERPQQYHLDLIVEDLVAAGEYALSLGARLVDWPEGRSYAVYLDPSGHPFCLTR